VGHCERCGMDHVCDRFQPCYSSRTCDWWDFLAAGARRVCASVGTVFRSVNASVSLLAAFFSLVGCSIGAVSCVFHLAPFAVLGNATFSKLFTAEQLQALVLLFLRLRVQTYNIGMVFFGFYCLVIGFLSLRSTFIPRFVGVLIAIAGLSWLTYLIPPLALSLSPYNLVFGFLGEAAFTVSLLAIGVSGHKRKERATAGVPS
jgi:hypothetical protein